MNILKYIAVVVMVVLCMRNTTLAQDSVANNSSTSESLYKVNVKWELPVAASFLGASYWGFRTLDHRAALNADEVNKLNIYNVNSFDRPVIFNDPNGYAHAQEVSDFFLNFSIVSPVILALDKRVRKDWVNIGSMFLVAHAVDNAIYFGAVLAVDRARPLTYNTDYPIELRTGDAKNNSFFSGHVSFSATSTFFAAKVYTDLHGIKGWKRLLIYTGAAVPPSLVGYYRMKAGKHFRTDVLLGLTIGAASGILIPEFHRVKNKDSRVSLSPFYMGGYSGFTASVRL